MSLKDNIDEVMGRIKTFYSNRETGNALIVASIKASGQKYKIKGLNQWNFPEDMYEFLDENIKGIEYGWQLRKGLDDDHIPCIYPRYGIAEHSAFVAGEVAFNESTSWTHPVISDWSDLEKLELREDNIWLKMVIDGLAYLKEKGEGKFSVMLRGSFGPMDLANALRGNDIYTDFYDYPCEVHRLMEFCVKACQWYLDHQKKIVGTFFGGTITGGYTWLPGNSIGHLSEDASVLCSPSIYREFGQPYTEKLVEKYDHAYMHLHTAGVHAYEYITGIDKLDFCELTNDPNKPQGIDIYKEKFNLFRNKIVKITVTLDEIKENIELLKQGKTILVCNVSSIEEAYAAVGYVRQELRI